MLSRCMLRTVSIVGAGRLGRTLGRRLRELGWRIGAVVTRSPGSAAAAVRAIGAGTAQGRLTRDIFASRLVLLTAPDDALAALAKRLAALDGRWRGKMALHASGALDRSVLAPLARRGAATGSLHPMQTFSGHGVPRFRGVTFAVEGDARARRMARGIVRALGGVPVAVASAHKPAYHAAAVLAAGGEFALIEAAVQVLERAGFSRRRALQALLPLIRQVLDNIERLGPRAAWTGPIARGDFATVARHARALRRFPREFQQAYAALALLAGRVLAESPRPALRRLRRALGNFQGGMR